MARAHGAAARALLNTAAIARSESPTTFDTISLRALTCKRAVLIGARHGFGTHRPQPSAMLGVAGDFRHGLFFYSFFLPCVRVYVHACVSTCVRARARAF